jgi:tetratricopeptide (TPR) repeat protein
MFELREYFELTDEVPSPPDKIRDEFPNWLIRVAEKGIIVIVLDALNQLEERDGSEHLGWLPLIFPRNIRLIVSTLPGACLNAIMARDWLEKTEPLQIQPLAVDERRELVRRFLGASSRKLSQVRLDRLAEAKQNANPLFLRAMLDELCVMGEHDKLDAQIDEYLAAPDPKALYIRIIDRWDRTYSEGQDLVARSFQLLCAARRGLSEAEFLDLLSDTPQPLPRAQWTPFFLAAEPALITRSGLLGFAHQYLRDACYLIFMNQEEKHLITHYKLADYFGNQQGMTLRKADEWPWNLLRANRHQELIELLVDLWLLPPLVQLAYTDVLSYWRSLSPQFNIVQLYEVAWSRMERTTNYSISPIVTDFANTVGQILEDCGYWGDAANFYERFMNRRMAEHNSEGLSVQVARRKYALCLARLGKYAEAAPVLNTALNELVQLVGSYHPDALDTASDLALVLQQQGDFDGAQNLHQWVLEASLFEVRLSKSASKYAMAYVKFLQGQDKKEEALQVAQVAAQSLTMILGPKAHESLLAKLEVGVLNCELGDFEIGFPELSQVAGDLSNILGPDHPQTHMAFEILNKFKGGRK